MNNYCSIECNFEENSFKMINKDAFIKVDNHAMSIDILQNLVFILRKNMTCLSSEAHLDSLGQKKMHEIICSKARQIVSIAEKNSHPVEELFGKFFIKKLDIERIRDLEKAIVNFMSDDVKGFLSLSADLILNIGRVLQLIDFVHLKASSHYLNNTLAKDINKNQEALIQSRRYESLKNLHLQNLQELRHVCVLADRNPTLKNLYNQSKK